ncbi:MAG: DUF362 domain-containing protein [Mariniphaga sp.]
MENKSQTGRTNFRNASDFILRYWGKLGIVLIGFTATIWFLIRVIPKPSRASYPCQQAAFPLASGFVLWLVGLFALRPLINKIKSSFVSHKWVGYNLVLLVLGSFAMWTVIVNSSDSNALNVEKATNYNYSPGKSNEPIGIAKGIFPGRVVWAHDPKATKWKGNWKSESDQYWLDVNTDQPRVETMLESNLEQLTGTKNSQKAWSEIFKFHNEKVRGLKNIGYKAGEIIALKPNFNNTYGPVKNDNWTDESPQLILAMIRSLVNNAGVSPKDIVVYDVRRYIPHYLLTKVWGEFKDIRFVQGSDAKDTQPVNPGYGDHRGLEKAVWVQGITYSNGKYDKARNIPKQVFDATYLINMAMLKSHSYPYNNMEDGDEGQTGISMCGKNHFGSIEGTPELHAAINTNQEGLKNVYSPMVDMAASPNLGEKTILYLLDGLYCGRKWKTYPIHFPNPPFNNAVEPYENTSWPASILTSLDGVALDCVGLDIYNSQIKNNIDKDGHSRILLRENADEYLKEMASANNPPSGTKYMQNGKVLNSLGVFEHWDNDLSRKYSRNIDPKNGKGIELIYKKL